MGEHADAAPQVLYVDPDEAARGEAAAAFEAVGHPTAGVGTREAAERRLERAEVTAVVSERHLPDGDALSFLSAVRERYPTLAFVVFTGEGDEAFASEAVGAGVSDYLPKAGDAPFERLADRVDDLVVDGRRDAPSVRAHRASPDAVSAVDASTDGEGVPTDGEGVPTDGEGASADGEGASKDGEGVPTDGQGRAGDGAHAAEDGAAVPADGAASRGPTGEPAAVDADVSEPLKERAMDEAPVGITIADVTVDDEPLIYINEAFERLTGFPADEVRGHNCRFLQGPQTDPDPVATMRQAIDAGEPASVELLNYRKDGERFWNRVDVAPIFEDGELAYYVGFQTDVSRRKRAEAAAQRHAEQLERERANLAELLDRVEGLVGDVTERVVGARTREAVERELSEGVGADGPYAFAWVGRHDLASEEVVPGASAGADGSVAVEEFAFGGGDPVGRAVETGELQVVDGEDRPEQPLHEGAPARFRSMAVVPLTYRESLYGVLAVYGTDRDTFDDRERAVLTALGRAAATAINAVESHRGLATDAVTELEFEVRGTDAPFVALAAELDCEVVFEGAVEGTGLRLLFDVEGADAGAVESWLAGRALEPTVLATHDEGCLVEFDGTGSVFESLAERGLDLRSAEAGPDSSRLVVHVPGGTDDRSAVEFVRERLPGASLHAYRSEDRTATTQREFRAAVEAELTDRQWGALRRAYASGYFDWPRGVDGDELAATMDITRATFHQHLRASQRKLVTAFYEGLE
jgi:PAS domain S-box-containing protein